MASNIIAKYLLVLMSSLTLFLPTYLHAQDNKLLRKAGFIVDLIEKGEENNQIDPLIKAIQLLLKEENIRKSSMKEKVSLQFMSENIFDLNKLYNKASLIANSSSVSKRKKKKLEQIGKRIKARNSRYKTLGNVDFQGIVVEKYIVQASGIVQLFTTFKKGMKVQFAVEVGSNFSLSIKRNNENLNAKMMQIGNQYFYFLEVPITGHYELSLINQLPKKEECILFTSTR